MLEELQSKIDLLQEQIDNLEKSGHFTEKEINEKSIPLKAHLSLYKKILGLRVLAISANETANIMMGFVETSNSIETTFSNLFGMTEESFREGKKIHNQLFQSLSTPNHQEA